MCNGVWLCQTCHRWAHAFPEQAQLTGFVVSQFISTPGNIPLRVGDRYITLYCTPKKERSKPNGKNEG